MKTVPSAACIAIALSAALSAGAARAETYATCTGFITSIPTTISSQGTWCLKKDVSSALSSGTMVSVTTNNVAIDCNGFKLGGLAAGNTTNAIGIGATDRSNISVRNCGVRGFRTGIRFEGWSSTGHDVSGNRVDRNTQVGISVQGTGHTVRRNVIVDTGGMSHEGGTLGIAVDGDADVIDNTIDGVVPSQELVYESLGIGVYESTASMIQGNRIRGVDGGNSSGTGIYVGGTYAEVVDNHLALGTGGGGATFGISCSLFIADIVAGNRVHGFGTNYHQCSDFGDNASSQPDS